MSKGRIVRDSWQTLRRLLLGRSRDSEQLRARLAEVLGVGAGQVNVKAKTAEKMGPVGEGRAIETRAVCLLMKPAA